MPTEWRLLCWLAPVWRHKNTWYSSPAAWISNKYSLSGNREQLLWQTCDGNWAVLHYTECKNKKRQKVSSDKQRSVSETNKVTLDPQWYQLVKQVIKQDRPEACFIHFWMLMRTLQTLISSCSTENEISKWAQKRVFSWQTSTETTRLFANEQVSVRSGNKLLTFFLYASQTHTGAERAGLKYSEIFYVRG